MVTSDASVPEDQGWKYATEKISPSSGLYMRQQAAQMCALQVAPLSNPSVTPLESSYGFCQLYCRAYPIGIFSSSLPDLIVAYQ